MKNKEKVLSEAEKRRTEMLEKTTEELKQQGYTRHDLLIGMGKANLFALVLLVFLFIIGYGLYYLIHHRFDSSGMSIIVFIVSFLVLVVVHELIHGLSWSLFTPHRFKDIEFGIMRPSMSPYCTCLVPLKKQQYLFGTVMPLIVLGIIPMIIGLASGNRDILFMGIVMADAAAGDIMIINKILSHKSTAQDSVYIDHPSEAGCVVFEK